MHRFWRKGERCGTVSFYSRNENVGESLLRVEVAFLTSLYGVSVDLNSEDGLKIGVRAGAVCAWISSERLRLPGGREFDVSVHDGSIWLNLGTDGNWDRGRAWRKNTVVLHVADWIFGKHVHSVRAIVEERDVQIPMPEGVYPAHVRIEDEQWKRSRWPLKRVVRRAHVDIPKGVPHAGKWGADGLYGLTTPIPGKRHPVEQAIGACVASVLGDRWRFSRDHCATGAGHER